MLEKLNCDTAFTIPVFGGIQISEAVLVTWIIMAMATILSTIFVRNLQVIPTGKKQLFLESTIGGIYDFFYGILGEHGKRYIPYLISTAIFIGIANLIGLLGLKPPTKDLRVTAALAIMSIILIEASGIYRKGFKKWLKGFAEPIPIIAPINILEIFIRPLSLCMRLFGNILGGFVVMELVKLAVPLFAPIPLSLYFDVFDGLIQAYVFVFLTALFISDAIEMAE